MRPRRLALLPLVALAVMAGGLGAGAPRATAASSKAATICVALVVDGRALGSDVSTSCAKVPKGSTGVDVLEAAGHTIGYRHDGLICTIDGLPKTGCAGIDDSHYWAYFHRAPGSTKWIYSSEGAGTYEPTNASTDGWVYDDGTANPPEDVPYAQICTPAATASPTPSHAATKKAVPVSTPKPGKTHHSTAPRHATSPSATPTPRSSASGGKKPAHHPDATKSPVPSPSTPAPTISAATSAALAGGEPPAQNGHGTTGLVIGVIVVVGLGILALVRFRRASR